MRRQKKRNGPVSWKERERRPTRRFLLGVQRVAYYLLARVWRTFLFRTTFIGITGSVGKTTCKEFLAAMLSVQSPTIKTFGNQNDFNGVPKTLLRVRPWHRFAVIEMGTGKKRLIDRSTRLVRPKIGIFLNVARVHMDVFDTLDAITEEKAALIRSLPEQGTAILNADVERIAQLAGHCRSRVVTFGMDRDAHFKAVDISSRWPQRLSFTILYNGQTLPVRTQLVGTHWVPSVLAAVAAAICCGASPESCATAARTVPPFPARLQPVRHPSGAILLRDEYNGSIDSLYPALEVLRQARAKRRVLVFQGLSYMPIPSRERFRRVGALSATCADLVVFIGKASGSAGVSEALAAGMSEDAAIKLKDLRQASRYLKKNLRSGDLVLIRGKGRLLPRMVYEQFGRVRCDKKRCTKTVLCDMCPELGAERELETCEPSW